MIWDAAILAYISLIHVEVLKKITVNTEKITSVKVVTGLVLKCDILPLSQAPEFGCVLYSMED
jgi:hypothetical protein